MSAQTLPRAQNALLRRLRAWLSPRAADPPLLAALMWAAGSVAAGLVVRLLLTPLIRDDVPYTVFVGSVVVSTRRGGARGGVAAMVLSLLTATYFFVPPLYALFPIDAAAATQATLFIATCLIVIASLEAETRARRQLEERDRLLQAEYGERMRLERELEQARRLDSLGRLAGGVAHDFNNLLTVVIGSAELLTKKLAENRLLDALLVAARRGADLTKQLLSLGRRQMFEIRPLSLNDAASGCLSMLRPLVPEDIAFATELEPEPWLVAADATGVHQVLLNLITNARDALPSGGTILLRTKNVLLDERFALQHPEVQPGQYVELSVSDSGAGMSEDTLSHVFEPFFTTKREGKGLGLGLPVAYGVVKQHRGHMVATSQPGNGSVLVVYLPRCDTPPAQAPHLEQLWAEQRQLSVLLVEDNDLVADVVASMLRDVGHRVQVAADGEIAIAHVRAQSDIDVLLTDVVMPRVNGPQLAELLGRERPELPVVFMSGYAKDVLVEKGVLSSCTLLKKPFSTQELASALDRAVTPTAMRLHHEARVGS